MNALPSWMSKLAALGLLIGLIAAVAVLIVLPAVEKRQAIKDGLEHSHDVIERLSALAPRREELAATAEALDEDLEVSGLLMTSANELLAAAELRDYVERAIGMHGGELQSSQGLPTTETEGLRRSGIRVTMTASIGELAGTLYMLEEQRPYLFIESLEIRSRQRKRRRDDAALQETLLPLTVRFDVHGYLLQDGSI